jgi:probable LLM family oxidoreductase
VISSDDPVRVFQNFATLDLISNGRAEIMAGRGSFTESFPLFGYDLADYDDLFEEKLELLLKIRESERVTWSGAHRAPIAGLPVYPRPLQDPLPVWIAVGGHPESVVRAGRLGLPLALAIIGGQPRRFVPLVDLYREAGRRAGHEPAKLRVSINSHGLIGDDSRKVADDAYAAYSYVMAKIGRERGWPPPTREQFEAERGPLGANLVGTPEEVAAKIVYEHELFGLDRFLIQLSVGTLPHEKVLHAIELFGTKVAPIVRREIDKRAAPIPMPAG